LPEGELDPIDRIVAQWRRERPDVDVSPLALLGRLLRAAHLADRALAKGIAGLQPCWFDLLARSGAPTGRTS
jgi:hypothetical protein